MGSRIWSKTVDGMFSFNKIVSLHHICPYHFETFYTHVFEIVALEKTDEV